MSLAFLTCLSTYILIILCELGDKTQVAVLLLTSNNPNKKWLILGASALALTLCVVIEVTVGVTLAKYIGPAIINRATGVIFLIVGLITLVQHFHCSHKIRLSKAKQSKKVSPNIQ